ncbi:MAG: hypothetical protein M3N29_00020 [Chloroflexota bacterium]|nr:hypothetical protein [Chloroflexota bacterium]
MTNVESSGPASVDRFTVRAASGEEITFEVGRLDVAGGKPAAHLSDHLRSGEPITVDYVVENGRNVAVRYEDAH